MNVKKSKIKIVTPIIALTIIAFGLIIPNIVNAGIWDSVGKDILSTIGEAVQFILNWLLKAAAGFFEGMLGIGFKNTLNTIKIGWAACRDFANMFFILFMVIIAFGTILRIEQYGIKKLLPKVIGIALLINFSMVFCSIIIDFSNLTADFFIKDIKGKIAKTDGTAGALTTTFGDAFNITGVYVTFTNCDDLKKLGEAECDKYSWFWTPGNLAICKDTWQKRFSDCNKYGSATLKTDENASFLNLFLGYTVGSIIMLIAVFTLFAGGIMLLFRIVAIWFLVTISPLVFICYIMPGLKNNWQKWWKTFLNWCIFAPAYAFFIWMAIQIAVAGANKQMGLEANKDALSGNYNAMANSFINSPGQQLISYFIIIGFLVGGLIVAKTLGIYGASTAMSLAQKAQKGATGWIKRKTVDRAGQAAKEAGQMYKGGARQLFGKGLQKVPGLKSFGAKMEAKGTLDWRKPLDSKGMQDFEKEINVMTSEQRDILFKNKIMPSRNKLVLARVMMDKDKHKMDANSAQGVRDILKAYSYQKEAGDFEEIRLDSIKDEAQKEKKTKEVIGGGKLTNVSTKVLSDKDTYDVIEKNSTSAQRFQWLNAPQNAQRAIEALENMEGASQEAGFALAALTGRLNNVNISDFAKSWGVNAFKNIDTSKLSTTEFNKTVEDLANSIDSGDFKESVSGMQRDLRKAVINKAYTVGGESKIVIENDPTLKGSVTVATGATNKITSKEDEKIKQARKNIDSI